jgi:transcriptional regulator with XRE-family HTH domain
MLHKVISCYGFGMSLDRPSSDPAFLAAYGEVVQHLRSELGLDRKGLAAAADISYSYLSAIESGQKIPSGTFQNNLARALGVEVSQLLAMANDQLAAHDGEVQLQMSRGGSLFNDSPSEASSADESSSPAYNRSVFSSDKETRMSQSGALAELRALLPNMSPEDAAMVVSMARRLSEGSRSRGYEPRTRTRQISSRRESRTEAYLRIWSMYLDELDRQGLDWARGRRPEPRSYFTTRSPIKGSSMSSSFARNHLIRHEMYINRGSRTANLELLEELKAKQAIIEAAYGRELVFEDPGQERRAVRLAEYRDGHWSRSDEFGDYVNWFIDCGIRMRRAIDAFVVDQRIHE